MKALSLTRPWAELVISSAKPVENRSWATAYRGLLLLHAAKSWDWTAEAFAYLAEDQLGRNLGMRDVSWRDQDHPTGIVGAVWLSDICPATVNQPGKLCRCGPWAVPGAYHWQVDRPLRFPAPVPCRGRLGLWDTWPDLDAAIVAALADVADPIAADIEATVRAQVAGGAA